MRGNKIAILAGSILTSLLLYTGIAKESGHDNFREPAQIIQQEDLASKVNNVHLHVLKGTKFMTSDGYVYEIDVPKYNLSTKSKKEYLTIYNKDRGNRHGFYDKNADGNPEVYIDITVYPGTANASSITKEAAELYGSKESKRTTSSGKYYLIDDSNRAEMEQKYEILLDNFIKDEIR